MYHGIDHMVGCPRGANWDANLAIIGSNIMIIILFLFCSCSLRAGEWL